MKNYHRQPSPVVVGTMFTSMQELAGLSDPNAVRFPYSTYSLSLKLAKQVGGWDVEWIAEAQFTKGKHLGLSLHLLVAVLAFAIRCTLRVARCCYEL